MSALILESPVYTIEAALKAAEFGVDRIELCSDLGEGGETPSFGALRYLKSKIDIPIYVMIRPRGGDFVYSDQELEVMKLDISYFNEGGADGFVFGVLNPDGQVNIPACKYLMEAAKGKPCTYHRAFDICANPEQAINDIIHCGFDRLLSSGNKNSVAAGMSQLLHLLNVYGEKITIMPGGGLLPEHLKLLKQSKNLKEVHSSCKGYRPTYSNFFHPEVKLSNDPLSFQQVITIDQKVVNEFKRHF
jgi:copper homeostasis protein